MEKECIYRTQNWKTQEFFRNRCLDQRRKIIHETRGNKKHGLSGCFFFPCFSGKQFLGTRGYNNSIPWNENPICFLRFSYSPKGPKMDSTSKINYRKLLIRFSNKNVFTIRHRFGLLESLILLIHFVFLLAHKLYRTQEFLLLQKYFYRFITPVTASFALQC